MVKDKKVEFPEDLEGIILRMPGSDSWLFLGRALGANPVPSPFSELYLALQQGVVDGQDNPLPTIRNAKFYEVTKSISITNHVIDSIWPSVNEEFWAGLTSNARTYFMSAIEEGRELTDATTQEQEQQLRSFFLEQGLSVYDADRNVFRQHVLQEYLDNKELISSWDMELFEKISE